MNAVGKFSKMLSDRRDAQSRGEQVPPLDADRLLQQLVFLECRTMEICQKAVEVQKTIERILLAMDHCGTPRAREDEEIN